MTIKFYLKKPSSTNATSIFAAVSYSNNQVKIYINESVEPVYWNATTCKAEIPKLNDAQKLRIMNLLTNSKELSDKEVIDRIKNMGVTDFLCKNIVTNERVTILKTPKAKIDWSKYIGAIKTDSAKRMEIDTLNERLDKFALIIRKTFSKYQEGHNLDIPTPDNLKSLIDSELGRGAKKMDFLSFFEDFVNRTLTGQRSNPKSKEAINKSGGMGYQTTLNHLKKFALQWNRKLDFDTVDLDFHSDFSEYLSSTAVNLSLNTIGSHIKRIKVVMAEAKEKGININMSFKSKYFVKQHEESADTIYLNEAELKEMQELDLTGNSKLDRVRDLFLIGCSTALRISDLSTLKMENIEDGFIRIKQKKTKNPVIIPVNEVVKGIIQKYNDNLPEAISDQKMNKYLKELGELLPMLKIVISRTRTKGGVKVTTHHEKHELLCCHTMRRTFATNEYKDGTLTNLEIMQLTGHKTEKEFLNYIKVTPEEHAHRIKEKWLMRDNRNKLRVA